MVWIVRCFSALLGALIVFLAFLQGVYHESLLPVKTDVFGSVSFYSSGLNDQQVREALVEFGASNGLEMYQLSSLNGTATDQVDLYSRGANQPEIVKEISWLQFDKTGSLYPSASAPQPNPSGSYALRGSDTSIETFKQWLAGIGASSKWEKPSWLGLLFLPLAYQGVILTLLVGVILGMSVVLAWYSLRSNNRAVQVLSGIGPVRIQFEDGMDLLKVLFPPGLVAVGLGVGLLGLLRGQPGFDLASGSLVLLGFCYLMLSLFGIVVSVLTWPSTKGYARRIPSSGRFSTVTWVLKGLVLVLLIAGLPLIQVTFQRTSDNERVASRAALLPTYFATTFIVSPADSDDFTNRAPALGAVIADLEDQGQVAYSGFRELHDIGRDRAVKGLGFDSVVLLNEKYLTDLKASQPELELIPYPTSGLSAQQQDELAGAVAEEAMFAKLSFYTPSGKGQVLAVSSSGVFQAPPRPLIAVTKSAAQVLGAETLVSNATSGSVLFTDPNLIVTKAAEARFNLVTDNASDTVRFYASDQRRGLNVMVASFVALGLATAVLVIMAAWLYALVHARRHFPRFLNGESWVKLFWMPLLADAAIITPVTIAGAIVSLVFEFHSSVILIFLVGGLILGCSAFSYRQGLNQIFSSIRNRTI